MPEPITEAQQAWHAVRAERMELVLGTTKEHQRDIYWSAVAAGFYKLFLGKSPGGVQVVLHVWDRSLAWAEHLPHAHLESFQSEVLKGAIQNHTFVAASGVDDPTHFAAEVESDTLWTWQADHALSKGPTASASCSCRRCGRRP
jgi:hypothetical protein